MFNVHTNTMFFKVIEYVYNSYHPYLVDIVIIKYIIFNTFLC